MTDLPILDELGASLASGFERAERRERRRRPRLGLLLPAAAAFVLLGGGAAAGTLLALRGSVIPGPAPANVQPQMKPLVSTVHVEPLRAKDPAGGAPWGVRIARSETGLVCTTAGQVVGDRFGIIGLDGRFRALAPTFVDGCGQERTGRTSLAGARVFYSRDESSVRTVIDGIAGPTLVSAVLEQEFKPPRKLAVSSDGAFVGVFAGYPEDVGAQLVLHFRDGHSETHAVGRSPFVVPDPEGGRAWHAQGFQFGSSPPGPICVNFQSARQVEPLITGPGVCGRAFRHHYFFKVQRFTPGESARDGFMSYDWHDHPARTVVWGGFDRHTVKSITVEGPGGSRRIRLPLTQTFLAIYPGTVKPADLTVVVRLANGKLERHKGSAHTAPFPRPKRGHR